MANNINISPSQPNQISISGNTRNLTITDNNSGTSVNISQPVTNIISVATPGAKGSTGPQGPSFDRKSEYSAPYSYNGKALAGSLTSENVWTITRLTIAEDGTITTGTATNVAWDNRTTVPYT